MSQIFSSQKSDGVSATFRHAGGSPLNVYLAGDLGGGEAIIEALTPDGSTWVRLAGGVLSKPGMHAIDAAPFVGRMRLEGAAGASLSAWAESRMPATRWLGIEGAP